jgi:hypothetical protein
MVTVGLTSPHSINSTSNPAKGIELPSTQGLPQIEYEHPSLVVKH